MKIREFALYTALVAGGALAGDRIENYRMNRQLNEKRETQKTLLETRSRLNEFQAELGRYTIPIIGDRSLKLKPNLSVETTGIDGTATVDWRPEYQGVFQNRK